MLFHQIFKQIADDVVTDLGERKSEEHAQVDEAELNDVDFTIYFDKSILPVFYLAAVFLFLLMLKAFWREFYTFIFLHTRPQMGIAATVLGSLGLFTFVVFMILPLLLILQPKPHIVKNQLIHRKRNYHYSEITAVRISTMRFIRVYAGKRKLFTMSEEYINCSSFLAWAQKCQIPVHTEPGIDEIQINRIVTTVILIVVVLMAVAAVVIPLLLFL